ncbi:SDR family oxidoreductase [Aliarcobacter butzleri]|uniref:SDR family NAD(P)-dependent oxidoreductase n=1 Tax=Aliarcobacter butzleri TaxID=28197 RepID=UPI001EDC3DDF|nr:SDR family oxidoreductase [Aliarcobacter butzleri]MCG3705721.1 SDR family oxidoreductase [Aliarcobacter butzleri]MDK2091360.1 SDR family NAD(P)-dependent oxidoreductase [Aliarcobacter butzleri]
MIRFNGENILVTGASDGIGKAICLLLNSLGANVIGIARSEDKLKLLKEEMINKDKFIYITRDLSVDIDELPNLVSKIVKEYGKLSGLVYAAGKLELLPIKGLDIESIDSLYNVNFKSLLMITKGFVDKRNSLENSSVVFISSISSILGIKGMISYSTSKGAINSLVKTLAVEVSNRKIRINSVLPGHVETNMTLQNKDANSQEYLTELETMYPLGLGVPDDIASLVTFLLSSSSKWITGQNIVIDGGRTLL